MPILEGVFRVERIRLNCVLRAMIEGSGMRLGCSGGFRTEGISKVNFGRWSNPPAYVFYGEFDSGSERTLAACLRHASRTGQIE